jgi:hypothetical protein
MNQIPDNKASGYQLLSVRKDFMLLLFFGSVILVLYYLSSDKVLLLFASSKSWLFTLLSAQF